MRSIIGGSDSSGADVAKSSRGGRPAKESVTAHHLLAEAQEMAAYNDGVMALGNAVMKREPPRRRGRPEVVLKSSFS